MDIGNTAPLWSSGLVFAGAVVGWLLRLERRLGLFITRREHTEHSETNGHQTAAALAAISAKLDEQNRISADHRERVSGQLHEIALDMVAVQTKVGVPRRRKIERG